MLVDMLKCLPKEWFAVPALELAPKLLGKIVKKGACEGIIVETEAYGTDAASHAYRVTPRSAVMRDTHGHWYVYFTYGMHWCANITAHEDGIGAVLIRAVEPIAGIALMKRRRKTNIVGNLCSGPAKFCQAFGITGTHNRIVLNEDFGIYASPEITPEQIGISSRIGISSGTELPWRFYIQGNPFASR